MTMQSEIEAYDHFQSFKREENMSFKEFIAEFEKRYNNVMEHNFVVPNKILAFRLLKSANLDAADEQDIVSTVGDLNYDVLKNQLEKVFDGLNQEESQGASQSCKLSLENLPNEALMEIVAKVSLQDILKLRETNLTFNLVCDDDYLIGKLKPMKFEEYYSLFEASNRQETKGISGREMLQVADLGQNPA